MGACAHRSLTRSDCNLTSGLTISSRYLLLPCRPRYIESSQRLQGESGVSQSKWEVADNMDLMQIMQQFEEYYEFKFQKKPVFTRASSGTAKAADSKKEKRAYEFPQFYRAFGY